MATVLVIQHFVADAPWYVSRALNSEGIAVDLRRTDQGDTLPASPNDYSGLVVLGGPASASQESPGFSTLEQEIRLFQEAHAEEISALGICLGAQILARAAGAVVYPGKKGKEIGWDFVELTEEGQGHPLFVDLPKELLVMQWHGDTFDLPDDATLLASGKRYPNQIFAWGSCVGLQPHLEIDTPKAVQAFIEAFPEEAELAEDGAKGLRAKTDHSISVSQKAREVLFSTWVKNLISVPTK